MKLKPREYARRVQRASPPSPLGKDCLWAFLVGGAICTAGQGLSNLYQNWGMDQDAAGGAVSITLILAAALLTDLSPVIFVAAAAALGIVIQNVIRRAK